MITNEDIMKAGFELDQIYLMVKGTRAIKVTTSSVGKYPMVILSTTLIVDNILVFNIPAETMKSGSKGVVFKIDAFGIKSDYYIPKSLLETAVKI